MIDIIKAQEEFKKYVSQFKSIDQKVDIKIKHTYGVVRASEYIAKNLKLSDEDITLAKLIGLLHDIGRFEQATKYDNFDDSAFMDHAVFGVELLFDKGLIRKFVDDNSYDEIIKKSIANHNKLEIEKGLNERELLHAKIIRDADKTDNFEVKQYQDFYSLFRASEEDVEKEKISDDVWNEFLQEKTIISTHRKTHMDHWLSYIAWVYDYNFIPGLIYLKNNDCVNKVIDRLSYKNADTKEKMELARQKVNNYIDKKINEVI